MYHLGLCLEYFQLLLIQDYTYGQRILVSLMKRMPEIGEIIKAYFIDNLFSLKTVIQKCLSKQTGRFYCLKVDFHKT